MADPKPTSTDAVTPQDQLKPPEGRFGQNHPTQGATDIQGVSGQQGLSQDMGAAGQTADNDQAGEGLGQNHAGYGGDNQPASGEPDVSGHDAQQQASQGIGARSDNLGASPTGGGRQPSSATTGGPDLSKGLTDGNRGGGAF